MERETGTFRVKSGLAEMLKGGVIMDVVNPEQAKIAEDAGAVAVMALERVPADIRRVREVIAANGLIVFHDYKHPCHPGVADAVDEIIADGGELISTHETLAVIRPPACIPLEV